MPLYAFSFKYGPRTTLGFAKGGLFWYKGAGVPIFSSHISKNVDSVLLLPSFTPQCGSVQYSIKTVLLAVANQKSWIFTYNYKFLYNVQELPEEESKQLKLCIVKRLAWRPVTSIYIHFKLIKLYYNQVVKKIAWKVKSGPRTPLGPPLVLQRVVFFKSRVVLYPPRVVHAVPWLMNAIKVKSKYHFEKIKEKLINLKQS